MRKILLASATVLLGISIFYTAHVVSIFHKRQEGKKTEMLRQYRKSGKTINHEIKRLDEFQKSFAQMRPHTKNDLLDVLNQNEDVVKVALFDRTGKFVYGYVREREGIVPLLEAPVDVRDNLVQKRMGWISGEILENRKDMALQHIAPVLDSYSSTPTYYLLTEFDAQVILEAVDDLLYSAHTFGAIFDKEGNPIVHPFYHPNAKIQASSYSNALGRPLYKRSQPVDTTPWELVFQIDNIDLFSLTPVDLKMPITVLALWSLFLTTTIGLIFKMDLGKRQGLWIASISYSFFCLFLIAFLFKVFTNVVVDYHEPLSIARTMEISENSEFDERHVVPTTIEIRGVSFPNASCFLVEGFISQVYKIGSPIKRGFIFPSQGGGTYSTTREVSRYYVGDEEIIVWQFDVQLNQSFDLKLFPFDRRNLKVTLWPLDPVVDVKFVPNVNEYVSLQPQEKPGISDRIHVQDWNLVLSQFEQSKEKEYDFFFKGQPPNAEDGFTFSIQLQRNMTNAFVTNFVPFFVCIIFAFSIFIVPTERLKSPILGLLSILVAILFVVAMNQTTLRRDLGLSSFSNIEYLFLSFYIMMILMSVNFIIYTSSEQRVNLISYQENLIPRLLYWPILLTTFLGISLASMF